MKHALLVSPCYQVADLSPVYWAGASLKRVLRARGLLGARPLSPVYWAGASLKRLRCENDLVGRLGAFPGLLGRGLIEALLMPTHPTGPTCFPRSTGPGPH